MHLIFKLAHHITTKQQKQYYMSYFGIFNQISKKVMRRELNNIDKIMDQINDNKNDGKCQI
jgi:hypothetical protein